MNTVIDTNTPNKNLIIKQYIDSMSEKEKKAYEIAKDHLGSLFNIEKTNGFLKWSQNK